MIERIIKIIPSRFKNWFKINQKSSDDEEIERIIFPKQLCSDIKDHVTFLKKIWWM